MDVLWGNFEQVLFEHDQVGKLANLDRADLVIHAQLPRRAHRRGLERGLERNDLVDRRQLRASRLVELSPGSGDLDRVERPVGAGVACGRPVRPERQHTAVAQDRAHAIKLVGARKPESGSGDRLRCIGNGPLRRKLPDDPEFREARRIKRVDQKIVGDGVATVSRRVGLDRSFERVQRQPGRPVAVGMDVDVDDHDRRA